MLNNVILWGNDANIDGPEIFNESATPEINDSIVQGGCPAGGTCTNIIDANPHLGPLADNGGITPTLLPAAGGAAIDTGNNATCLNEDQRGVSRPLGGQCDIGAVERVQVDLAVVVSGQGEVTAGSTPVPANGGIENCDQAGAGQPHCAARYVEGASENVILSLVPAANWHLADVGGCGGEWIGFSYIIDWLNTNCTITVTFGIDQYTVIPAVVSGMGTISPDTAQTVDLGDFIEFTVTPETGWSIDSVGGTCTGTLAGDTYTAGPINADCTVEAAFVQDPVDGQCGAADGGVFTEAPTEDLCAVGEPTEVLGDGPWSWFCQGIAGGEDAQCSADFQPPLNEIFGDRFED